MVVAQFLSLCIEYYLPLLFVIFLAHFVRNKFSNGLNKYPGPGLAAYTNLWRFCENWSRASHWTHLKLHRKHGDVVRLGPNSLSFADPRAIQIIYGLNKGMKKSEFYPIQQPIANGRRIHSLFSTTDEVYHAKYRRCVNGAFAMSNFTGYEPLVDSTIDVFIQETSRRFCNPSRECDFYQWLLFLALDIMGELTWSKRMGFLEQNRDVGGVAEGMARNLAYAGPIGQIPWLDLVWTKNPIRLQFQRWGWSKTVVSPTTVFALQQNHERADELRKVKQDGIIDRASRKTADFLTKFTQARTYLQRETSDLAKNSVAEYDHPDFMDDGQVLATCNSMITAGTETTAITLSSIFNNLMRHPKTYHTLMEEIGRAVEEGIIAERPNKRVSWAEAQKLKYLDAVIQESFRLHPAVGLTQEKVVPPEGIEILGHHIPGNVIVGCNPWVLQRRPDIFGADVDAFRPERWLEASTEQLRQMKAAMFQFGGGSRTCIGKHIALFDIYKIVPTFLRNFEMELVQPELYRHQCVWMVRVLGFHTRLSESSC